MNEGKKNGLNKETAGTCFLLLEPRSLGNSGEIARKIARFRGVREVHLTSGKYGFVVSADAGTPKELNRIRAAIKRTAKSKSVSVALSHFIYK